MTMRPPPVDEEEDVQLHDNLEQLLMEINEFCRKSADKQDEIPENLETYMKFVAKTGNTVFPWQDVRPLFRTKMMKAISDFGGEPSPVEPFIFERFDIFRGAPFTIQRMAELITSPKRHYKVKDKYLRGLEKTVLVVTTIEPGSGDEEDPNANQEEPSWLSDPNVSSANGSILEPPLVEAPLDNSISSLGDSSNTSVEELQDENVTIIETVDFVDGGQVEEPVCMETDDDQGISGTPMPGMNTSAEDVVEAPAPVVIEEVVKDSNVEDQVDLPMEPVAVEEGATVAEFTAVIETVITAELYTQAAQEAVATVMQEVVEEQKDPLEEQVNADDEPTPLIEEPQPEVTTTELPAEEIPASTISDVLQVTEQQLQEAVADSDLSTITPELASDVVASDEAADSSL